MVESWSRVNPTRSARKSSESRVSDNLETMSELLDRIQAAEVEQEAVHLDAILAEIGSRSFGPLLLLAGLVTLAPFIGAIPGVPTIMGIMVMLTAGQLLLGRNEFWLPQWVVKRSVKADNLEKAVKWMRKPARFVDRIFKPRLTALVQGIGVKVVAVACIGVSAMLPAMELVPFSALSAGAALTAFGLALISRDGLLALIAMGVTLLSFVLVVYYLW